MNAIEELSVEIKIAQAELDQLIYIHKHYKIPELLSDISIKHSQLRDLRESYFNQI